MIRPARDVVLDGLGGVIGLYGIFVLGVLAIRNAPPPP